MSEKHFTPINLLLPQVKGEKDPCLQRLEVLLNLEQGVGKTHIIRRDDQAGICVHYDPDIFTLAQLNARLEIAGAKIAKQYQHKNLQVQGMDCPDCAKTIEHTLERLDGVIAAKVSYAASQLRLEFDSHVTSIKKVSKRLKYLGYTLTEPDAVPSWWHQNGELTISLLSGLFLLLSWILSKTNATTGIVLAIAAFALGGCLTFRDAIQTILQKRFDIDVLMLVAAIGAAFLGAWAEGALLLFLFSLGHSLEHKAMDKARRAVKALANLAPKTALVKRDGVEHEILVEELQLKDIVIVKPGQRIPVDGEVQSGNSTVDQAPITGESIPVDKQKGDGVFAGTINGDGILTVTVGKLTEDSTLSRMVRMVLEADTQKSPTQRFTDKFVKYFVPSVLVTVLFVIVIPPLLFTMSWTEAFYRAMSVLVAASPCALAIATPATILSGVARAAQKGVLIKGGMHLENLGRIKAIAFDKTGTLTQGKPEVQDIKPINIDENELLSIAASLEHLSSHPLAKAVVDEAKRRKLDLKSIDDMKSVTGKGLQGVLNGELLQIGSLRLFENFPSEVEIIVNQLQEKGRTIMVVKLGDTWLGALGLADSVREESKGAIKRLLQIGLTKTIMLTGDNERVANAVAEKIGISEVRANLLPEDKLRAITELDKQYKHIAMVGDGINDAPAMARATVGIAMGGAGTDVALEASDVALMADDLSKLPFAVGLSRSAQRIIRQNLIISLSVVAMLIVATLTGLAGLGLAVTIHEGSTLLVVANALRLLRYKD